MAVDTRLLREFVRKLLVAKGDLDDVIDDEPLLSSGRLESIEVIEIVGHLEEAHGVDFAKIDFDPDSFESIASMVQLIEEASES